MMASALLPARLRHDAERVIRAWMAGPTPPGGMRGPASRAAIIRGSPCGRAGGMAGGCAAVPR
jgi:hypothetical protein